MAQMTVFTPEELQERQKKRNPEREERERQIAAWIEVLRPASPGWGGEVRLDQGEDKLNVRRRIKAAADHLGLTLRFRPVRDETKMLFSIIEPPSDQSTDARIEDPDSTPPTPKEAKPKRRPKSHVSSVDHRIGSGGT